MSAAVTVRGADTLARTLHRAAADVQHLTAAHTAAGQAVTAKVRARTHRLTGRLAASWRAVTDADGVTVSSRVVYAGVQERRNHALSGGLAAATPAVQRIYFGALTDTMGKVRGA